MISLAETTLGIGAGIGLSVLILYAIDPEVRHFIKHWRKYDWKEWRRGGWSRFE